MRGYLIAFALAAFAASPANAYLVTQSSGPLTSEPGAVTFATFDAPTNTAIGTVTGGSPNGGSNPGGGGNWIAASAGSSVVVTLTGMADYFGFHWGSNDGDLNEVHLFQGSAEVGVVDGTGHFNDIPNRFWNITAGSAGEWFDKVAFTFDEPPGCCFEVDNFAARLVSVPEPSPLGILAIGLAALALHRRSPARETRRR